MHKSRNKGTISASSHKLSSLASCDSPATVTALRSYIGAYKVFNRVLRSCFRLLESLESAVPGRQKHEKIIWSDSLLSAFKSKQSALASAVTLSLPNLQISLFIVHDGAQVGIGSVLYLLRNEKIKLGGFFSAKLKAHQSLWYPCEIEALSISTSVSHFGPYIRQSLSLTQILTDNKPCVQACEKMIRGQFSTSSRVLRSIKARLSLIVAHFRPEIFYWLVQKIRSLSPEKPAIIQFHD